MIDQPDTKDEDQLRPAAQSMLNASYSSNGSSGRAPLGKTGAEDEAGHLRRVADELGGANMGPVEQHSSILHSTASRERRIAAAAELGSIGDRHATAILRALLEQDDPTEWEIAVHGLRQSRDRIGWMCLESVALDHVWSLESSAGPDAGPPLHAFRLLVMGRTKTMDRLFRAIDGHSRSLSATAALTFATVAVRSVPEQMSTVMALRLGISRTVVGTGRTSASGGTPATPEQVSQAAGLQVESVRRLEGLAWETVQRSRPFEEIRRNYEVNSDRFRAAD